MSNHRIRRPLVLMSAMGVVGVAAACAVAAENAVAIVAGTATIGLLQWWCAPWALDRLLRAHPVPHDGQRYLAPSSSTEGRVGSILARRCAEIGLPLPRLAILDVDEANAFTFGRGRRSTRVVVTRTLADRLDDAELDAVICHELGHVEHRDVALMTALSIVPMLLYVVARLVIQSVSDDDDDEDGALLLGLALFVAYFAAELCLAWLSRTREYAADRWSCEHTGDFSALPSALAKLEKVAPGAEPSASNRYVEAAKVVAFRGRTTQHRFTELFSTHPSLERRIAALEHVGPSAPSALERG